MKSAVPCGLNDPKVGGASPAPIVIPNPDEQQWSAFMRLVASEYPYSKMFGAQVVDGCLIGCEAVQRSFPFGPKGSAAADAQPGIDAQWETLRALCEKLGSGRLDEIRFNGGRPVAAFTQEGGRRFRQRLARFLESQDRPKPMS